MKNFIGVSAISLAAVFSGASQAQTQQSITVFTSEGLSTLTLDKCYKMREIDAELAKKGQKKIDIQGRFFRQQAASIYADPSTGSYTIVGVIEDEDALIKMPHEQEQELIRTGRIDDYKFSCVLDAGDSGYPDQVKQKPIYKKLFTPQ